MTPKILMPRQNKISSQKTTPKLCTTRKIGSYFDYFADEAPTGPPLWTKMDFHGSFLSLAMFWSYVPGTFWYYIDLWVPLINNASRHLVSHRDIKVAIIKYIIKIKLFFGFIAAVLFLCFFLCLRISWQTLWVGSCRYSGRRPTGKCIVDITLLILSPLFVFNFSRISWTKFLSFFDIHL